MAENKKSFLLYCDLIHTVSKMPKEKAGELFIHILEYVNDLNPETEDLIIQLTFEPIKQALKRDLKKYENIVERNKENGKKGGRPKNPVGYLGTQENPIEPRKADSDSDSVIYYITSPAKAGVSFNFDKYLETINEMFGRNFKVINEATKSKIKARLKEKYTKDDFYAAMLNCKANEFHINNNYQYCTPEYFSRADILNKYSETKPQKITQKRNLDL